MNKKAIATIINSVVITMNDGRPSEKAINLSNSSQLIGTDSVLDSLDIFMFVVELESQLKMADKNVDVMKIIETAIIENQDIELIDLISKL